MKGMGPLASRQSWALLLVRTRPSLKGATTNCRVAIMTALSRMWSAVYIMTLQWSSLRGRRPSRHSWAFCPLCHSKRRQRERIRLRQISRPRWTRRALRRPKFQLTCRRSNVQPVLWRNQTPPPRFKQKASDQGTPNTTAKSFSGKIRIH